MTEQELRDHFAAAALTGLSCGRPEWFTDIYVKALSDAAWGLADAMLAARGEPQPSASGAAARPDGDTGGAVTLTDAEREALGFFCVIRYGSPEAIGHALTLRGLHARAKEGGR